MKAKDINLVGSMLILFCIGQKFTLGAIVPYYASYLKLHNPQANLGDLSYLGIVALIGAFLAVSSIPISKRFNMQLYMVYLVLLETLCYFFSLFIQNDVLFITICVFFPIFISTGLIYAPVLDNVWKSCGGNRGQVTGMIFAAAGFGQIIFIIIGTYLINPKNLPASVQYIENNKTFYYFPQEVADNVQSYLIALCITNTFLMLPGACLIKEQLQQINQDPDNSQHDDEEFTIQTKKFQKLEIEEPKLDIKTCLSSNFFRYLFIFCMLLFLPIVYFGLNAKAILLHRLNDDHFASYIIIVAGVSGGIGRLGTGYLSDFRSPYFLLYVYMTCLFVFAYCFYIFGNSYFQITLCIIFMNFADGGILIITATMIQKVFGKEIGGQMYTFKILAFYAATIFGALFGIVLGNIGLMQDDIFAVYLCIALFALKMIDKMEKSPQSFQLQ